jgi:chromosomal replication initiator protein
VVKDDSDRLSVLRDALRRRVGADRFDLWLGERTRLELTGNAVRVICASHAELQFVRRKLHRPLAECCVELWSPSPTITFEESRADGPPTVAIRRAPVVRHFSCMSGPTESCRAPEPPRPTGRKFATFAIGASNRLAAQAARDLAHHPGRFSPLLLHGPNGCGKSHLLEAINHEARAARGRVRTIALTSEQFTSQFLDALHRRAVPSFRHKMREIDLLLVDDVHFFEGKKATLEELLYTLDALHGRHGQAVLTSDRSVSDLRTTLPALASRLGEGLAQQMEPPDYGVRTSVVRAIGERVRVELSDAVVELVARQVVGSARLLSGAVNRLVAESMAASRGASTAISLELAERALAAFCRQHAPQVRLQDIQRAVCDVFDIEPATLRSQRKTRAVAEPRMLCMWLARRFTRAALSEIGTYFGGRSHSTVVSAKRKFDALLNSGGELVVGDRACPVDEAIRRIEARLRTG